jgi:Leucine-rich repeat (LRR) protein
MHEFPVLSGLLYLEFINFTNNAIENISNIGMLDNNEIVQNLYIVILNNNLINEINLTFHSTIPVIKYIALADNRISYRISGNNLSELPGGLISDLSSAKIISLGSNPISIIPQGFFSSVKELQVLDLHSTQIGDSVLDNIQKLSSLHELHLGNCAIRSLTRQHLSKLNLVQYLDISGNHIKKFSNYTFIDFMVHIYQFISF